MQPQGQAPAQSQEFQNQVRATQASHGATPWPATWHSQPLPPVSPPPAPTPTFAFNPLPAASPIPGAPTAPSQYQSSLASDKDRMMQLKWLQSLQASANGRGPSAASALWRSGADRIAQQAQSAAASQPGLSPAAAARMQMMAQGSGQQNLLGGLAAQRAQEQQAAQQLYTGALGGVRGQDIQGQLGNRGLDVQGQLGNRGLDLTGRGQDLNYVLGGRGQDVTYGLGMGQIGTTQRGQDIQKKMNDDRIALERSQGNMGAAFSGLGALGGMLGMNNGGLASLLGGGTSAATLVPDWAAAAGVTTSPEDLALLGALA